MLTFDKTGVKTPFKEILSGVSLTLRPHTITAVIGKNGSGKTTLMSCLNGERKYTGNIAYDGKDIRLMSIREKARLISFLPQILPTPCITVKDLVRMGRSPYLDIGKNFTQSDEEYVEKALVQAGIKDIENKYLTEASGGEKQKAYIAMVLAQNTRVIALDEPTTYMDMAYSKEFLSLLGELRDKNKKTVLTVMHDINSALEIADNILILNQGRAEFFGSVQQTIESGKIEEIFGLKKYECICDGEVKFIYR